MSGEGGGGQERSLKATPQRMKQVRREGKLGRSQDLAAWTGLGAGALMLPTVLDHGQDAAVAQLAAVRDVAATPDPARAVQALVDGLSSLLLTLGPLLAVLVLTTVAVAAAQGGVHARRLKPHFEQLNLVQGVKRLFGGQAWWQGTLTLLKSAVVALVLVLAVQAVVPVLAASGSLTLAALLDTASQGVADLLRWGVGAGVLLALADLAVVLRRNRKHTRMTPQEAKEEHKRTEGDPLVRGAIRARQLAMSRNRMMAEVANADVVVVNPTHVAVALRYEPGTGAPRVVAKGAGAMAARIRREATDHRVPLVEDVALARALHAACEPGQEIPEHLFTAVARVLAFVMTLRRRGAAAGSHRLPGGSTLPGGPPPGRPRRARAARAARGARSTATTSATTSATASPTASTRQGPSRPRHAAGPRRNP
ncbi:EscU/YscU/HrcU family type III secretion system export apparatus switch protein [Puerhibacterium puerhi]|uniref:EscU/YscU/HrcU family type III secretion system export apparatus switch protein n=1 Tax=Puerhibacterium puerhi TaxID=2692623 RepID=UPI00135C4F10|nr:EscU/YscU/HrcU family type III secretion system export apparatus switch protein [Puerhibacterium puerhi]